MFASGTAEVINFEKKKKTDDLFTKILYVHKKLKEVAQYESISKTKYQVAKLNKEQLEKVKLLESKFGCCLVAYEGKREIEENKLMILNRVHSLLDEYLDMCKPKKEKYSSDEFGKFFE